MTEDLRHPKPEPLLRIPADGHAILEGSAGTGKTRTLEDLVVDFLVDKGIGIGEILVVTISREAAAAMKRRVRERILSLLALRKTATTLSIEQCWILDASARERLRRALLDFDQLRIGTARDWAADLVRENPFLVHRLFQREPSDERALFSLALADVLADETHEPYLSAWLDARRSSIRELEDLLFRAVSVRGRLAPSYDPESLLRAARALPDLAELEPTLPAVVSRTAVPKIQRALEQLRAARGTDDPALLLGVLDGLDLSYLGEKLEPLLDPTRALDREAISLSAAMVAVLLPPVRERLSRRKRESGSDSGEDAIQDLLDTLESPRGPELLRILRKQHRAVLIDELQEIDEAQWGLFRRAFVGAEANHTLRVACDPKGALGAEGGGDIEVFLRAKSELAARGAVVSLVESFRATPELVEGLNLIFDQDQEQPFFTGRMNYDKPLRSGRSTTRLLDQNLSPKPPVVLLRSEGDHAKRLLAAGIADEIRAITADPDRRLVFGERGTDEKLRPKDVLVLTATDAESDEIVQALELRGIGSVFLEREGLFLSRAAKDVRTLLLAIESPSDRTKCVRAFLSPFFGLSLRALGRARDLGESDPLVHRLMEWRTLAEQRRSAVLFDRILEESGIALRARFSPEHERVAEQVAQVFESLAEDRSTARATLPELVRALDAYIEGRARPSGGESNVMRLGAEDAVRVSTIGRAKGLEATVVFLFAFSAAPAEWVHPYHDPVDGARSGFVGDRRRAPPEVRAAIEREEIERSQRLLYFALTRARARLYLPLVPDVLAKRGIYAQLHERLQDLLGVFPIQPISNGSSTKGTPAVEPDSWEPPASLTDELAAPSVRGVGPLTPPAAGRWVGTKACLREVLAAVPLHTFENGASLSEWRKREDVAGVVLRALRATGADRSSRAEVEELAYAAFTTAVPLVDGKLERGFSSAKDVRRSVDYVLCGGVDERKTVAGSLDLLFQHEGLTYVCDFVFVPNGRETVDRHCLAALEMLRISSEGDYLARFGGTLSCCFVGAASPAILFARPTWPEIQILREGSRQ